jgi:hypothetical protein
MVQYILTCAGAHHRAVESEKQRAARYAAKDVLDKLGVTPGSAVRAAGTVRDRDLIQRARKKSGRPPARAAELADVVLFWPNAATDVTRELSALRKRIDQSAGVWVISAKRGHERPGRPYLGNDVIALGLAAGLVDNKICSVSETETAMRFVIRRSDRRSP